MIQFLQSKRDANVPAWKRMWIIEGLITFRREVQPRASDDLVLLQIKMGNTFSMAEMVYSAFVNWLTSIGAAMVMRTSDTGYAAT